MKQTHENKKLHSNTVIVIMKTSLLVVVLALLSSSGRAFTTTSQTLPAFVVASKKGNDNRSSLSTLMATTSIPKKKKGYEPKWKKLETLADKDGKKDFQEIGLKGTIPVVFKQGTEERRTVGLPGQPIREVAIQAGQFIKYGCGKGECGTCECLSDGKWIRPCSTNLPSELEDGITEIVIQVKEAKSKASSSGKFYSIKSFFSGAKNNILGMVGMVKYRKNAKDNYSERIEYESLIKQRTMEKKLMKEQQEH